MERATTHTAPGLRTVIHGYADRTRRLGVGSFVLERPREWRLRGNGEKLVEECCEDVGIGAL